VPESTTHAGTARRRITYQLSRSRVCGMTVKQLRAKLERVTAKTRATQEALAGLRARQTDLKVRLTEARAAARE
jgi:hypothetical protein